MQAIFDGVPYLFLAGRTQTPLVRCPAAAPLVVTIARGVTRQGPVVRAPWTVAKRIGRTEERHDRRADGGVDMRRARIAAFERSPGGKGAPPCGGHV
jgi:hypothetical protein